MTLQPEESSGRRRQEVTLVDINNQVRRVAISERRQYRGSLLTIEELQWGVRWVHLGWWEFVR